MRVAILDDDVSFSRALVRLIRLAGFEATVFNSAQDFLSEPIQQNFDCLLLDVQLGSDLSGLELFRLLLDRGIALPAIFITAQSDGATEAEARRLGCVDFLAKSDAAIWILDTLHRVKLTAESAARDV